MLERAMMEGTRWKVLSNQSSKWLTKHLSKLNKFFSPKGDQFRQVLLY
jgi:hypothetical protein